MQHDHPTIDEIADYSEDLLPADQAQDVRTHLDACDRCTDTLAALSDVSDVLASTPAPPMPVDVAQRLDAAIAAESHQRATGVVSLASKRRDREESEQRRPGSRRNAFRIIGAAAAALVVVGVASSVVFSGGDDDTNAAGDNHDHTTTSSEASEAPSSSQLASGEMSMDSPADVREMAEQITSGRVLASGTTDCTLPDGLAPGVESALSSYHGKPAVVVIESATSHVSVYDCSGEQRLFRGRF